MFWSQLAAVISGLAPCSLPGWVMASAVFLTVSKSPVIRCWGSRPVMIWARSCLALPKTLDGWGLSEGAGVTWFGLLAVMMARFRSPADMGYWPAESRWASIWYTGR